MAASPDDVRVVDNRRDERYELWVGETRAGLLAYRETPRALVLVHTETDPAFEGQGLGGRLVKGALDDIRSRGLRVVLRCPFASAYVRRHPEYADLVSAPTVRVQER